MSIPLEVIVIAENLLRDMVYGIRPQSHEAAGKWLALAQRKYPGLAAHLTGIKYVQRPRKLPARAV